VLHTIEDHTIKAKERRAPQLKSCGPAQRSQKHHAAQIGTTEQPKKMNQWTQLVLGVVIQLFFLCIHGTYEWKIMAWLNASTLHAKGPFAHINTVPKVELRILVGKEPVV